MRRLYLFAAEVQAFCEEQGWSRRITQEHRLVYRCENETIIVMQCRFHYDG